MVKTEAILPLVKPISEKESAYTDTLDKKDLTLDKKDTASIDEPAEMPCRSENIKMPNIRHILSRNKHTTFSQLRTRILFIQSRFQLIEFNDGKKR